MLNGHSYIFFCAVSFGLFCLSPCLLQSIARPLYSEKSVVPASEKAPGCQFSVVMPLKDCFCCRRVMSPKDMWHAPSWGGPHPNGTSPHHWLIKKYIKARLTWPNSCPNSVQSWRANLASELHMDLAKAVTELRHCSPSSKRMELCYSSSQCRW